MALACQLLYVPVCVFTKISLLITYLSRSSSRTSRSLANFSLGIFPGKANKYFCYTLMVYEVAWGIASFFASLFQCAPVQSYWLIQSPVRDCVNVGALYYSTSGLNIFTDCTYRDQRRSGARANIRSFSPYLPLASQRPRFRPDLCPPTHYADHYVLSRSHHLRSWIVSCVVHLHLHRFLGFSLYVSTRPL
jgi:hypothetical protein